MALALRAHSEFDLKSKTAYQIALNLKTKNWCLLYFTKEKNAHFSSKLSCQEWKLG